MLIENEFTASAPVDELWAFLLDVQRIAPCMPGAELTEIVDDHNWKGKLNAKFGPVKRVAAAVGEGSMAIAFVHQFLRDAATSPAATTGD